MRLRPRRPRWPKEVVAIALALGFALAAHEARAEEVVPLPVLRLGLGIESRAPSEIGMAGSVEVGAHLHYRLFFFGGELGASMVEHKGNATATFVTLGAPVGVTSTEALVGGAFTPRVIFGERFDKSIFALRVGATLYALGGIVTFEFGHERWFGDVGSAHLVGLAGLDAGRAFYLLLDGDGFNDIR